MDCTQPAPSSCEPSPKSQESRWPPTKIYSSGNSLPLISPITLYDRTSSSCLQFCFKKNLMELSIFNIELSKSASLVLIAAAGILCLNERFPYDILPV